MVSERIHHKRSDGLISLVPGRRRLGVNLLTYKEFPCAAPYKDSHPELCFLSLWRLHSSRAEQFEIIEQTRESLAAWIRFSGITSCGSVWDENHRNRYANNMTPDHDPLFQLHRWWANLRIPDIEDLKSAPFVSRSHPLIERRVGTLRRERLNQTFFWNDLGLHRKLVRFATYYMCPPVSE